jgi:uncharacterized protein (TIGR03435 family)
MMTVAILLLAGVTQSIAQDAAARFEVASVKRNTTTNGIPFPTPPDDGVLLINHPLDSIVRYAFDLEDVRVLGLPQWTREERFDITARAGRTLTLADRRAMTRTLLADRFGLRTHTESRDQTVLVLARARADGLLGPGLKRRQECETTSCSSGGTGRPDGLELGAINIARLATMLSAMRRQIVHDETGLTGIYDVKMTFRPDETAADTTDPRPSFFSALEEQLGLRLTPQRRPVEVLVVDAISRPTPD